MADRTARPGAASLWRDPVILAVVGFSVLGGVWYLAGWGGERARVVGFGVFQSLLTLTVPVLCLGAARLPGLPAPTRRIWTALGIGSLIAGIGDVVQVVLDLDNPVPTSTVTGTAHQVGLVIGVCFPVWAMLTLPNPRGSRREQVRFWLDASTVMAAAVVFAWYFSINAGTGTGDARDLAGPLLVMGVEVVAAFAVVKLLLTGAAGFAREAALCGALGVGLDGLTAGTIPTMMQSPWLPLLVAAQMLTAAMIVCAPRIQELRLRADPQLMAPAARRPYSLLPYLAVAATLTLLVVVLIRDDVQNRVWGVLAGVILSTGLVVARQLAAFSENANLLTQLDASYRELRRQEQLLRHQASHDHLTQLANRVLFTERARDTTRTATDRTAVIMIDLDDFKPINDTLGHHVGDAVLVAVADRLTICVRPGDTVARLGGDEFAILLPHTTEGAAATVVDRITTALTEPVRVEGHTLTIRVSIGLATGTAHDPDRLLRDADHAMYTAKRGAKAGPAPPALTSG